MNDFMRADIESEKTVPGKMKKLIEILKNSGNKQFEQFIKILKLASYEHVATTLEETLQKLRKTS